MRHFFLAFLGRQRKNEKEGLDKQSEKIIYAGKTEVLCFCQAVPCSHKDSSSTAAKQQRWKYKGKELNCSLKLRIGKS